MLFATFRVSGCSLSPQIQGLLLSKLVKFQVQHKIARASLPDFHQGHGCHNTLIGNDSHPILYKFWQAFFWEKHNFPFPCKTQGWVWSNFPYYLLHTTDRQAKRFFLRDGWVRPALNLFEIKRVSLPTCTMQLPPYGEQFILKWCQISTWQNINRQERDMTRSYVIPYVHKLSDIVTITYVSKFLFTTDCCKAICMVLHTDTGYSDTQQW